MTSNDGKNDDEWEQVVLIAEVNGVLDANLVRQAIRQGSVSLRNPAAVNPVLQVSNSLYTGKWVQSIGTDMILEADNNQLKILSTTDRFLKTEKALLTAKDSSQASAQHNSTEKQRLQQLPKIENKN